MRTDTGGTGNEGGVVKTYNSVFDIMHNQTPTIKMVDGIDADLYEFLLFLKRPNGSVKNGFFVYVRIVMTGIEIESNRNDSINFVSLVYNKFVDRFDEAYAVAFPYIEDGCVEVATKIAGPWKSLMPEVG